MPSSPAFDSEAPDSPADAVAKWIASTGCSQKDAALELQWKDPELSMLLGGHRPISERMARDLARVFADIPPYQGWTFDKWIALQKAFTARSKSAAGGMENLRGQVRVGVLCDCDICEAVEAGTLKIKPFDKEAVQPASYDLHIESLTWFGRFEANGERRRVEISGEQTAILAPKETVIAYIREAFLIPANMTARLAAVGSLVEEGVQFTFGIQMEPGWAGQPFFTLTHHGDKDITFRADEVYASVEFQYLQRPAQRPHGKARRPAKSAGRVNSSAVHKSS